MHQTSLLGVKCVPIVISPHSHVSKEDKRRSVEAKKPIALTRELARQEFTTSSSFDFTAQHER